MDSLVLFCKIDPVPERQKCNFTEKSMHNLSMAGPDVKLCQAKNNIFDLIRLS
jgi:hypothetical protein